MNILLVVPGGGDPKNNKYLPTYELLETHNLKVKKYDDIRVIPLLGHESYNKLTGKKTYWHCVKSTDILLEKFIEIEKNDDIIKFDIFARSGGCPVTLMSVKKYQPFKLNRIICWGPATYQSVTELFLDKYEKTKMDSISKGLFINHDTYESFVPFENLIEEYNQRYKLTIGHGSEDEFSNHTFGDLLKSVVNKNHLNNRVFINNEIDGGHVITESDSGYDNYIKMIFDS